MSQVVAGLLFAGAGQEADIEKMKEARNILKKKAGVFSAFRDATELVLLARMAMAPDMEQYIDDLIDVFNVLMKGKVFEDSYMVLTAMIIVDRGRKADAEEIKTTTDEIMKRMSKLHPILTSSEDLALAALLAMSGRTVDDVIFDMEECYKYTKKELKLKAESNSIQALSQILAITGGDIKAKCDKVAELFEAFKENGEGDLMTGSRFRYSGMKLKCVILAASVLLASVSLAGCFETRSPRTARSQANAEVKPGTPTEASPTPSATPTPDPKDDAVKLASEVGLEEKDLKGKYDLFIRYAEAVRSNPEFNGRREFIYHLPGRRGSSARERRCYRRACRPAEGTFRCSIWIPQSLAQAMSR